MPAVGSRVSRNTSAVTSDSHCDLDLTMCVLLVSMRGHYPSAGRRRRAGQTVAERHGGPFLNDISLLISSALKADLSGWISPLILSRKRSADELPRQRGDGGAGVTNLKHPA